MMKVATAKEMQGLDRKAMEEHGIPGLTLMENAGTRVVEEISAAFGPPQNKAVTVVAGKGNNGGDGLVVARLLHKKGAVVRVFLTSPPDEVRGDAHSNLERYQATGGAFAVLSESSLESFRSTLVESDLIVDAIFGTGLSSPITGETAKAVDAINQISARRIPVIAIDISSGINADTGQVMGVAIYATLTVTFGLLKRGHFLFPGAEHTGKLKVVDIGIPPPLIHQADIPAHLLTPHDLAPHLLLRPADVHKGSFGHLVVVAGSVGKSGAAVLTSLAALRTGAGLVTLATPQSVEASLGSNPPELMTLPLAETGDKTLAGDALGPLLKFVSDKTVVAIGPGLSTHPETSGLVRELLMRVTQPVVMDADGLNALAGHLDLLHQIQVPMILTPHPGEMGRLTGLSTQAVQQDRLGVAQAFSQRYKVIVVLKGAHTIIATPEGDLFINPTGNPGMATAGTGDVLTGMIAGLIAQRYEVRLAAQLGVYLHGLAGDLAAQAIGTVGLLASDMIARIPQAIRQLRVESCEF